jgi:hypothetical protein
LYYGLDKIVNPERFNLWYLEVKGIPTESILYIQKCLFADKDSMPRNIPKYVKQYFSQWLSANPAKKAGRTIRTKCDECASKGLLWFKKQDGYIYVVRCAKCQNWAGDFNPSKNIEGVPVSMTLSEIERQGWVIQ